MVTFPNNPNINDTYTASGRTWKWTGSVWKLNPRTLTSADITDFNTAVGDAAPPTTDASLLTSGTLDAARLSAGVTTSLGKADSALQPAPVTYLGDYNNGASYNLGAVVKFNGGLYKKISNPLNPGYPPSGADWELFTPEIGSPAYDLWVQNALAGKAAAGAVTALETRAGDIESAASTLAGRVTTSEGNITTLTSGLATEKGRVDAILSASDADKDSFAEIVQLINSVNTDSGDAFAGYVTSNNATVAAIEGRTTTLEGEMDAVEGLVSDQDSRLTSAETSISGLGTISTQDSDDVNITGGTISGVNLSAQTMEVGQGSTADLYVGQDGKVGIGTEAPTEKLTVNGNISVTSGRIKNLGTPVDATDAATKGYVDTAVAGVQASLDSEVTRATTAEQALETNKQIKITTSDTPPAHADGREWLDTTDYRRYISISGAWIEGVVV